LAKDKAFGYIRKLKQIKDRTNRLVAEDILDIGRTVLFTCFLDRTNKDFLDELLHPDFG